MTHLYLVSPQPETSSDDDRYTGPRLRDLLKGKEAKFKESKSLRLQALGKVN